MISFWKRTFLNDVLPNNRYLMKYAVAHRKYNYCCHSIIYIQECITLVEGLLFGFFEAEDVTFLLCRCSTLKLRIVSNYLTGSVQYWLSIFLSMRAHMCGHTRQHKLSLLAMESEHVWKRGRGTAKALKCWRHPLVAQANWVGETGLLSSSRGVCWWPSLGSLQKQEHKYQVQCFPFEKGSLILVPCQTLVIFDSEMCSFGYDFLSSLTMCPNVQICPSSMLHFNRGHILLLFYISNRSCWVEDILR